MHRPDFAFVLLRDALPSRRGSPSGSINITAHHLSRF